MNTTPAPLLAIKQDYCRVRTHVRQVDLVRLSALQIRRLLNRFIALRTRLLRCRGVISRAARRLRALLLRSTFGQWRAFVRQLAQSPLHSNRAVQHIRELLAATSPTDPHNWPLRLMIFDAAVLAPCLPELLSSAPPTARDSLSDPYWKALKGRLALTSL